MQLAKVHLTYLIKIIVAELKIVLFDIAMAVDQWRQVRILIALSNFQVMNSSSAISILTKLWPFFTKTVLCISLFFYPLEWYSNIVIQH